MIWLYPQNYPYDDIVTIYNRVECLDDKKYLLTCAENEFIRIANFNVKIIVYSQFDLILNSSVHIKFIIGIDLTIYVNTRDLIP